MARDIHETDELQPLLDRLATGDESAVDRLIERSVKRMHRLAHFMLEQFPRVHRWYETDDVYQAAVLRLSRALKAVQPTSPRDFLNLAAVQIRRELYDLGKHEFGPEGPGAHHVSDPVGLGSDEAGGRPGHEKVDPGAGPATQVRWRDFLHHVQQGLPEEEREVFDYLFIQGLSQEETAQVLGVSVPTVKRRWRSARLLLHKATRSDLPLQ